MGDLTTNSPAGLLRDYVIQRFSTLDPTGLNGWAWSLGKVPLAPDQVIVFIDQGGPSGFPHLLVDHLGLQVIVRGSKGGDGYNTSYLMVRKIRDAILGADNRPTQFAELSGITERG